MPICTTCTTSTPFLYTVYESAYNLRLEQCRTCHAFVDPYVEHDTLTLLLDLILLKRGVYRHLLYNRGSKPRRASSKAEYQDSPSELDRKNLSHARWIWTIKLGAGLVILDAFIRWTHLQPRTPSQSTSTEDALLIFARVLSGCFAETLAFHAGILFSCFVILQALTLFKNLKNFFQKKSISQSPPSSSTESSTAREFNLSLIPLTLFYSSLTKLFLLLLLTIWTPAQPEHSSPSIIPAQIQSDWFNALLSNSTTIAPSILSDISKILDDDKLDREWVIRNILGGMSAGFGLRVILDVHPFFSTLIILSGWMAKTAMAQLVGEWVGGGTQLSQAWLAHSIP